MKLLKLTFSVCILMFTSNGHAQGLKLKEGSLDKIASQSQFNIEFTYDSLKIKNYASEAEYMAAMIKYFEMLKEGDGEIWERRWKGDRERLNKPRFYELFEKYSNLTVSPKAKYTMIFHTAYMNMGASPTGVNPQKVRPVNIDGEITITETANRATKIAVISFEDIRGGSDQNSHDPFYQISECYAYAGKLLAKFMSKLN